jgi:multidrug efflux system membrane fusion protein
MIKVAFTEGQMVREGDLLAQIDPRPFQAQLQQAEGTLAKDEATLQLAKITLARGQGLLKKNSISQQEIDTDVAQVQTIEGTVQTDKAMVATAKLQLTYCKIIAPISGRIGLRLVDQGNIVHAADLTGMAVITQLQPIALVFPISQDEIPRVQKQMHAGQSLTVYAYDRNFKMKLATGKLAAIDNQVDSTTGTVRLKAVFDNEDGMLYPNQFVNAQLLVDTNRDAVVVPNAAVQRGPASAYVYVVQPDERVKLREVQVGLTEGADTAITTGLTPGEIVVTDGIDKLKDDALVSTKDPKESRGLASAATESPSSSEKRTERAESAAAKKVGKK